MRLFIFTFSIIFLASCAAKLPTVSDTSVSRASKYYEGITLADLEHSKTLYETSCGACHPAKKPSSRNEQQWRTILPEMVQKAYKKGYIISQDEEAKLLAYILSEKDNTMPK